MSIVFGLAAIIQMYDLRGATVLWRRVNTADWYWQFMVHYSNYITTNYLNYKLNADFNSLWVVEPHDFHVSPRRGKGVNVSCVTQFTVND